MNSGILLWSIALDFLVQSVFGLGEYVFFLKLVTLADPVWRLEGWCQCAYLCRLAHFRRLPELSHPPRLSHLCRLSRLLYEKTKL